MNPNEQNNFSNQPTSPMGQPANPAQPSGAPSPATFAANNPTAQPGPAATAPGPNLSQVSPQPYPAGDPGKKPITKQWWFWSMIAGGVIIVVLGGALLMVDANKSNSRIGTGSSRGTSSDILEGLLGPDSSSNSGSSGSSGSGNTGGSNSGNSTSTDPDDVLHFAIGETAYVGDEGYTFNSFERNIEDNNITQDGLTDNQELVKTNLTISNGTNAEKSYTYMDWVVVDEDGNEYESELVVSKGAWNYSAVPAGESKDGDVYFTIKKGAKGLKIGYKPFVIGSSEILFYVDAE